MAKYNDNGHPQNYYFVVAEDEMDGSLAMVAITPIAYYNKEGCLSDWHINVSDPHLDQCMESSFLVEEWPDGVSDYESMHNYMIKQGYQFDHGFATFMSRGVNNCFIPPCSLQAPTPKPVKVAKLSTDFFKKHIATNLANDPDFSEIMDSYAGRLEQLSMYNPKMWKRTLKHKCTLTSIAAVSDVNKIHFRHVFMEIDDYLCGHKSHQMVVYDEVYMSNHSNTITIREFVWKDCPNEDTTISFVTDETDTRIVAICYHID